MLWAAPSASAAGPQASAAPAASAQAAAGTSAASPAPAGVVDETKLVGDLGGAAAGAGPNVAGPANFGVWDLLRMVIILGLVVAAIYGIFYLIRKGSRPPASTTSLIGVWGSQSLPGGQWIHLVAVQKQLFLLGGTDSNITLIKEITDAEAIDEMRLQASQQPEAGKARFADLIGDFFAGGSAGGKGSLDFLKRQRDRLKRFKD